MEGILAQSGWLLGAAAALLSLLAVAKQLRRLYRLPPGPWGVPLVGYLPWIDRSNSHRTYLALAEKYGDIFSFQLGGRTVIALASYDLIREAFSQPLFSGRIPSKFVRGMTRGCGILFTEGEVWSRHRGFSLHFLRSLGFAKEASAKQITAELRALMTRLDEAAESGRPVTTIDLITPAVNSVIARLTLGRSFPDDDPDFRAYIRAFDEYARLMNPLPMIFPFIDQVFHLTRTAKQIRQRFNVMFDFILGQVLARRRLQQETQDAAVSSCLADAYNAAKAAAEAAGDFETYADFQIVRVCMELFFGGTATTARTLEWMLLFMALHPLEQEQVQLELDACRPAGSADCEIRLEDRESLNYTMAVIDECYRRVSLSSNGTFHRATQDVTFHGHWIPQDAAVMPLAYAVHHSPRYWEHPHRFYPGHFLDSQGRYTPSRYLIPFMIGRRVCLGEGLARQEIFLIFANLMRRYRVALEPECARLGERLLAGRLSLIRIPERHEVVFERRN